MNRSTQADLSSLVATTFALCFHLAEPDMFGKLYSCWPFLRVFL